MGHTDHAATHLVVAAWRDRERGVAWPGWPDAYSAAFVDSVRTFEHVIAERRNRGR